MAEVELVDFTLNSEYTLITVQILFCDFFLVTLLYHMYSIKYYSMELLITCGKLSFDCYIDSTALDRLHLMTSPTSSKWQWPSESLLTNLVGNSILYTYLVSYQDYLPMRYICLKRCNTIYLSACSINCSCRCQRRIRS